VTAQRIAAAWGGACLGACGGSGAEHPTLALLEGSAAGVRQSPAFEDAVTLVHDPGGAVAGWAVAGACGTGGARPQLLLVPPGRDCRLQLSPRWRLLHMALPLAGLAAVAAEIGVPLSLCRLRFAPGFLDDADLRARLGRAAARLRDGLICGRLEVDELALEIGLALVTRHVRLELANGLVVPPVAAPRRGSGDAWRQALIAEAAMRLAGAPEAVPALLARILCLLAAARPALPDPDEPE